MTVGYGKYCHSRNGYPIAAWRWWRICFIAALLCSSVFSVSGSDETRKNRITPVVCAVSKVMPAVVNLNTEKIVRNPLYGFSGGGLTDFYDFLPDELLNGGRKGYSLGSGCVIDVAGLVVTNAHVVHSAVRIKVTCNDGNTYDARALAVDEVNDIALLRIVGTSGKEEFTAVTMAAPGDLLLGETVVAVGNAYGLGSTVSQGVLSAIGRKISYQGRAIFTDMLQTDAKVYPGNSGGPLINVEGKMIGINTAILKNTEGIGFAIPLERVENLLAGWLIPERFSDVSLGIVPAVKREKNGELVFYLANVIKDSPAWKAGLRSGRQITAVDGERLEDIMTLCRRLWKMQNGDRISITAQDKKTYVPVAVASEPVTDGLLSAEKRLGIKVRSLTSELAAALDYPVEDGVIVSDIKADNSNIRRGDLLVQLGDTPIQEPSDIARAFQHFCYGDNINAVLITVRKSDGHFYFQKKLVQLKIQ